MTALCPGGDGEWVGFWAGDYAYYARHTKEDGGAEWFQVRVEESAVSRPRRVTPRGLRVVRPGRTLTALGRMGRNATVALVWRSSRRRRA